MKWTVDLIINKVAYQHALILSKPGKAIGSDEVPITILKL